MSTTRIGEKILIVVMPEKLYINLANAVTKTLDQIFDERKYADKVIEKVLKSNKKWGARDRKFIAETTYDIVRWYRLLSELTKSTNPWKLMGAWLLLNEWQLPPWDEFQGLNKKQIEADLKKLKPIRKIYESIPDWLDELGEKELGKLWDKEIHALNETAQVVLRVNKLKTTVHKLTEIFDESEIALNFDQRFPDAIILNERSNIFQHPTFKAGLFEVQDAGSQLIAPFMDVKPGMRVIDACAGAGGKTLHLAALMQNKGRIIAMDTEQWKLDELKKRAARAGADNIETRIIDSAKAIKRLENNADRLLLDVPCSGLGVLKRNPDAKWKLSIEFIEKVKKLQQQILQDYSIMLKPGGILVYSTCSILTGENHNQVKIFLANNPNFELLEDRLMMPSEGFDGFYMAKLKKK